jgi:hypothetical protein
VSFCHHQSLTVRLNSDILSIYDRIFYRWDIKFGSFGWVVFPFLEWRRGSDVSPLLYDHRIHSPQGRGFGYWSYMYPFYLLQFGLKLRIGGTGVPRNPHIHFQNSLYNKQHLPLSSPSNLTVIHLVHNLQYHSNMPRLIAITGATGNQGPPPPASPSHPSNPPLHSHAIPQPPSRAEKRRLRSKIPTSIPLRVHRPLSNPEPVL